MEADHNLKENPTARLRPVHHHTIDDEVFFAIITILFEADPHATGMTVKQICDILIVKHPEMDKLSTKTSNLVSAKLNAYIKRIEKNDSELIYALTRDWADVSPKRMVYAYKGELPKSYRRASKAVKHTNSNEKTNKNISSQATVDTKTHFSPKSPLETMQGKHKLRSTSPSADNYSITNNVPDSLTTATDSPSTASPASPASPASSISSDYDYDYDEFDILEDDNDSDISDDDSTADLDEDVPAKQFQNKNSAFINESRKRSFPFRNIEIEQPNKRLHLRERVLVPTTRNPNQLSPQSLTPRIPSNSSSNSSLTTVTAIISPITLNSFQINLKSVSKKWISDVQNGFLIQDIESPENVSVKELESLFESNL